MGRGHSPMRVRYNTILRERVDRMLAIRATVGETMYLLIVLAEVWDDAAFLPTLGVCVVRTLVSAGIGTFTAGRMDRRFANWGFFLNNVVFAIALYVASGGARSTLGALPLATLFYEGFGEGELRPFIIASLLIVGPAILLLGAPPIVVATILLLAWLVHWFSAGRAILLNHAITEVQTQAADLASANEQLHAARQALEENHIRLQASFDELQATHEKLIQIDKMVAIGQLAAGVAHEINNPLAVILGFAQGIARRVDKASGLAVPIESIVREALRCKELVQELLVFSRTGTRPQEPIEIEPLVRSTAQLLEARAREQNTALVLELSVGSATVTGNRTQLQQIIVNLANNAFDALRVGGRVTLRALRDGDDGIRIDVRDDGPGIPAEIRSRIFDPFFTTKDVGSGTGLGLSLVYEMVQKHGGNIVVESAPGDGTTMRVRLPLFEEPAIAAAGGAR
jgi:signal transduction histidine kinase